MLRYRVWESWNKQTAWLLVYNYQIPWLLELLNKKIISTDVQIDEQISAFLDKTCSLCNIYSESKCCSRIRFFVDVGVQYILEK